MAELLDAHRNTVSYWNKQDLRTVKDIPNFMLEEMEVVVQNFYLSRTSINNILKKHKLNGYQKKLKSWKFFRAKYANELWQVDLKEFKFEGRKKWCIENDIKPLFAHPYYPQDKGKVERTIRNLAEEFINLLNRFKHWINGKMEEWRVWFNEKRYHRGIKNYPSNLYAQL